MRKLFLFCFVCVGHIFYAQERIYPEKIEYSISNSTSGKSFDGDVKTSWFPGWNKSETIILTWISPQEFHSIKLYDGSGISSIKFNMIENILTVKLNEYQRWRDFGFHPFKTNKVEITLFGVDGEYPIPEIQFFGKPNVNIPNPPPVDTATPPISYELDESKKINLNGFHWVPLNKLTTFSYLRMYQSSGWTWMEGNKLAVSPTKQANGDYDKYLEDCKKQGLIIVPAINQTPDWFIRKNGISNGWDTPPHSGNKTDPKSYCDFAEYWWQLSARYGKIKHPDNHLKVDDTKYWAPDGNLRANVKKSGLDLLQYVEVWNEPDKWWNSQIYMEPEEYCAMLSACYDGHEGMLGFGYGIKNADPNMKVVMAGLTGLDLNYLNRMKAWAEKNRKDKKIPCDVINIHHYNNGTNDERWPPTWTVGCSPESDLRFYKLKEVVDWAHALKLPLWYSEFGYDTKLPSWQFCPSEEQKANWLSRIYLLGISMGVDNLFVFNAIDEPGAENGGLYQTSGILESEKNGFREKVSFIVLKNLVNELKGFTFVEDLSLAEKKVILLYNKQTSEYKLAMWTNDKNLILEIGDNKIAISGKIKFLSIK